MIWYRTSRLYSKMYHNTSRENVFLISQNGLKINQESNKTVDPIIPIMDLYGVVPIFLALDPNKFKGAGDVTFEVDVTGLDLVADIVSLGDIGAYFENEGVWWETDSTPPQLVSYLQENEDEMLYYDDLVNRRPLIDVCIELTQTAACETSIPPSKLKLIG